MPIDSYVVIILTSHETNCLFMAIKLALYMQSSLGFADIDGMVTTMCMKHKTHGS